MKSEERLWWATLCLADEDGERIERRGPKEEILIPMRISGRLRSKLCKEFGANLDNLFQDARDKYREMYAEEKAKDEAEKKRWEEYRQLIERTEALLGKKSDGDPDSG